MSRRSLILTLMMIGLTATGMAQGVFGYDTIALGDQTTVRGRLERLDGDGIEVLSVHADSTTGELEAVVTSFEPGEHWLHIGEDDSLMLVVTDVEIDTATAELRDIADVERVPYTWWEIVRWVLLVLGVAAVVVVALWLYRRKQTYGSIVAPHQPVDNRTPYERAKDRLEALRRKQLWQSGKEKEYHTELTDALRCFIEEATGLRATDMTSDETIAAVMQMERQRQLATERDSELLQSILTTADLVKFAKVQPQPYEHERSMEQAMTLIENLWLVVKPQETAKQEEGKGDEV